MNNNYYSRYLTSLFFVILCSGLSFGQTLLGTKTYSSSGQTFKSNGYTFDVTIGETFVNSYVNPGIIVSQGQHQPRVMTFTLEQVTPLLKSTEVSTTQETVNETSKNVISTYPNPVEHTLTVELEKDEILSYTVMNMQGQIVLTGYLDDLTTKVNFENFVPGNYIFYYSTPTVQGSINLVKI